MDQSTRDFLLKKTEELLNAFSCCKELKEAATAWKESIGTDSEPEKLKAYIAEVEDDIVPIDALISLAGSDAGAKIFGADKAKEVASHGEEIKKAGAKYCDCPACAACEAICARKDEILA